MVAAVIIGLSRTAARQTHGNGRPGRRLCRLRFDKDDRRRHFAEVAASAASVAQGRRREQAGEECIARLQLGDDPGILVVVLAEPGVGRFKRRIGGLLRLGDPRIGLRDR